MNLVIVSNTAIRTTYGHRVIANLVGIVTNSSIIFYTRSFIKRRNYKGKNMLIDLVIWKENVFLIINTRACFRVIIRNNDSMNFFVWLLNSIRSAIWWIPQKIKTCLHLTYNLIFYSRLAIWKNKTRTTKHMKILYIFFPNFL